jgi:hypothetical protein
VTAADTIGGSAMKAMSIDVVGVPPLLPNISPHGNAFDDCTIGVPCSRSSGVLRRHRAVRVVGQRAAAEHVDSHRRGVTSSSITPGDLEIWGTPDATTGPLNVQLTVTDATGATATNTFPLKVSPLLQTSFLANGTLATAYSQTLRMIGGTSTYTAGQTGGQFPSGVTLNPGTLLVTGTPNESGFFSPIVTFADSASHTLRVTEFLPIAGAGGISINNNGDLGSTDRRIAAGGGDADVWWAIERYTVDFRQLHVSGEGGRFEQRCQFRRAAVHAERDDDLH